MNLATIIGIPLGFGLLLLAYLIDGGNAASLVRIAPLIIIFGGTLLY